VARKPAQRSVRTARGGGPRDITRAASLNPYRGELESHSSQGHDHAVHFLRRLVDDWLGLGSGLLPLAAAQPARRFPLSGARRRMTKKIVLIAGGGTGGPLFPAAAFAEEMARRDWRVMLMTDARGRRYAENFPAERIEDVMAASL